MKSLILVFNAALLFAAGKPAIPVNVMNAFSSRYPKVTAEKWAKNDDGNYSVTFMKDKKREVAFFSAKGDWMKTDTKINSLKELPAQVKESLKNRGFLGDYISNMKNRETPKSEMYVLDVNDANRWDADHVEIFARSYRLYFDRNGDLINKKLLD
ncbi:MAG TPA: PepSY-like domain-containing protein [Puia sp.]|nr:PepSY-like domain-containing protein [Puia sp.]